MQTSWKNGLKTGVIVGTTLGLVGGGFTAYLYQGASLGTLVLTGAGTITRLGLGLGLDIPVALAAAVFLKIVAGVTLIGLICSVTGVLRDGKKSSSMGSALALAGSLVASGFTFGLYTLLLAPMLGSVAGYLCSFCHRRFTRPCR